MGVGSPESQALPRAMSRKDTRGSSADTTARAMSTGSPAAAGCPASCPASPGRGRFTPTSILGAGGTCPFNKPPPEARLTTSSVQRNIILSGAREGWHWRCEVPTQHSATMPSAALTLRRPACSALSRAQLRAAIHHVAATKGARKHFREEQHNLNSAWLCHLKGGITIITHSFCGVPPRHLGPGVLQGDSPALVRSPGLGLAAGGRGHMGGPTNCGGLCTGR